VQEEWSAFTVALRSRNPNRRMPFASQNAINNNFPTDYIVWNFFFIGVWYVQCKIHDTLFKTASIVIWHSATPLFSLFWHRKYFTGFSMNDWSVTLSQLFS
jgi:hypothetical protein